MSEISAFIKETPISSFVLSVMSRLLLTRDPGLTRQHVCQYVALGAVSRLSSEEDMSADRLLGVEFQPHFLPNTYLSNTSILSFLPYKFNLHHLFPVILSSNHSNSTNFMDLSWGWKGWFNRNLTTPIGTYRELFKDYHCTWLCVVGINIETI